jgi:hypothetical protein
MLTELAKREPDRLAVDVDDQGVVQYRIANIAGDVRVRVQPDDGWPVGSEADAEVPVESAEGKKGAGA